MNNHHRLNIKTCPTCKSNKIQRVIRDITREYKSQSYIVPDVGFFICPDCGEKLFDHEALEKMKLFSPAYNNRHLK